MKRFIPRAALALTCFALAGCAALMRQAFVAPTIAVSDVRLAGVGTQGGTINVLLTLHNANGYRIDATDIQYNLRVDTLLLASGTINQRVTLLQKDSAKVRVPVNFGLKEVMLAGQQLSKTGSLPFKIDGEVTVETAFGNIRRAFAQTGTYDGMNFSLMPPKKK
jgi:LEA14-like dessication related protein